MELVPGYKNVPKVGVGRIHKKKRKKKDLR